VGKIFDGEGTDGFLSRRQGQAEEGGKVARREVGEGLGPTGRWWAAGTSSAAAHSGGQHAQAHNQR
jgi:hypothetical protein